MVVIDKDKYYTRRAVQMNLERDAISKKLKTESQARINAEFLVASVMDTVNAMMAYGEEDSDSTLTVDFSGYKEPFTVKGLVSMNLTSNEANVQYGVQMDPLKVKVRLECGTLVKNGIRPASVLISTPSWASVVLDTVAQSSNICSPPAPPVFKVAGKKTGMLWFIAGAGATYAAHRFLIKE